MEQPHKSRFKNRSDLPPEDIAAFMEEAIMGTPIRPVAQDKKIVGQCRLPDCAGSVVEDFTYRIADNALIGGPPPPRVHNGYHCELCGLVYYFPPPDQKSAE